MLVRLLYASRAVDAIGAGLIDDILARSHALPVVKATAEISSIHDFGEMKKVALTDRTRRPHHKFANLVLSFSILIFLYSSLPVTSSPSHCGRGKT